MLSKKELWLLSLVWVLAVIGGATITLLALKIIVDFLGGM